jgi:flagellar export protein FliJ
MESSSALVRLKEFQVDGHRRKVAQLRAMIADFDRLAAELEREIAAEETRSGNSNPAHFAYPTYAKAARQRRDNLKRSTADLALQLETAQKVLAEASEELDAMTPAPMPVSPQPEIGQDLNRAS